jgi:hypothetical protein
MPDKMKTEARPRTSVSELFEEAMSKPVSELYEQAMGNYEQALRTGLRMQEESGKWWTNIMDQASSPHDWQKWMKAMSDRLIPETQKNLEENMCIVEQNNRTGVELMKKAMEAAQSSTVMEGQAKFLTLWGASLNAFRENAQAATQANTKAIEMWVEFLRRNAEMAGNMNGGKPGKD